MAEGLKQACPYCGITYTEEEFKQLKQVPRHTEGFWNYIQCKCGKVIELAVWKSVPLEELKKIDKLQLRVLLIEWMNMVKIRRTRIERSKCTSCPIFPQPEFNGEEKFPAQVRGRVNDVRESCVYSLTWTTILEDLLGYVKTAIGSEETPEPFPELLSLVDEFEGRLAAFRESRHQDEGANDPIP